MNIKNVFRRIIRKTPATHGQAVDISETPRDHLVKPPMEANQAHGVYIDDLPKAPGEPVDHD